MVNDSFGGNLNIASSDRNSIARNDIQSSVISSLPPPHVKEHIANIQSDNQSLMRRLNLVI